MKQRPSNGPDQTSPLRKRKQRDIQSSPLIPVDAVTRDIHNINDTLSRFVGGRQKSWMLGGSSGSGGGGAGGAGSVSAPARRPPNEPPRPAQAPTTSSSADSSSARTFTTTSAASGPEPAPAPSPSPSCPPPDTPQPAPPPPPGPSTRVSAPRSQSPPPARQSGHALPSPAPSHSPPGMEHRLLGQPADGDAPCSLPTPRESVSWPSATTDEWNVVWRSNSTTAPGQTVGRANNDAQETRKRSRDAALGDPNTGPNKRLMIAPHQSPPSPPVSRPSPLQRPTLDTTPVSIAQPHPPQPQQARQVRPVHASPPNQTSPPPQPPSGGVSPYISAVPGHRAMPSPGMQQTIQGMQLPTTHNFSPVHSLPPSPGPSPVQQSFPVAPVPAAQLHNAIRNFVNQFSGNPTRQLTTGDINRLNILRDAVSKDDWHFLIAHQLYIARTVWPAVEVNRWSGMNVAGDETCEGWTILQHFLRSNNELSGACLSFMLSFPMAMQTGYLGHPSTAAIVQQFHAFLTGGHRALTEIRSLSLQNLRNPDVKDLEQHLTFNSLVLVYLVIVKLRNEVGTLNSTRMQQQAQQRSTIPQQPQVAYSPVQASPHGYFDGTYPAPVTYGANQQAAGAPYVQTQQYVAQQNQLLIGSHRQIRQATATEYAATRAQTFGYPNNGTTMSGLTSPTVNSHPSTRVQDPQRLTGNPIQARVMSQNIPGQQLARRQSHEQQLSFGIMNQRPSQAPAQLTPIGALQYSRTQQTPQGRPTQRVLLPGPIQENILQSKLASPIMTPAPSPNATRQLHISLVNFAVKGFKITSLLECTTWNITPEAAGLLSRVNINRPGEQPTRPMVVPGNLIYRLRCIEVKPGQRTPVTESDWVLKECVWPPALFVSVNNHRLEFRRKVQWGKDLPTDITNYIIAGTNDLRVAKIPNLTKQHPEKHPDYYISVEIFEANDQEAIKRSLFEQRYISARDAEKHIMQRLATAAGGDDDDDLVVASSNVNISLTCPLSFGLITIPVRGKTCKHVECFDYDNFMSARPKKRPGEPPIPDSYRCPHCKGDVRPGEMVIDGWIAERLRQIRTEMQGVDVRAVVVEMNGEWKYKIEDTVVDDDETESENDEAMKKMKNKSKKPEPEIICIDDD